MTDAFRDMQYLVLTGNYGSGKTELALNLALGFSGLSSTTLVDLDIVNPYFRSGEKAALLQQAGIRVLMPTYAMTTVDIPALPAEIQSVFDSGADKVIFDVGGDDTGAAALGRYYPSFAARRGKTAVVFAVNCMRPLTRTVDEITELAERIRSRGRLAIDILVNNTNLADQTTAEMLEEGEETVLRCAERMGISRVFSTGTEAVLRNCRLTAPAFPVRRFMVPDWMVEEG